MSRWIGMGPWLQSVIALVVACVLFACGDDIRASKGTRAYFDVGLLDSEIRTQDTFFDFPYPSELRLQDGGPDLRGYPNPNNVRLISDLIPLAQARTGFSTMIASYFRFDGPVRRIVESEVIPTQLDAPLLIINLDEASEDFGALTPVVARTLFDDDYVPANTLAVAPRPGFVLEPATRYAVVVMRSLGDEQGTPLGTHADFQALLKGENRAGASWNLARGSYAHLAAVLAELDIDPEQVAIATVFQTGDVVKELALMSDELRQRHSLQLGTLQVDSDDGDHERFCELRGEVLLPQFQTGVPPFSTAGVFEYDDLRVPIVQRDELAQWSITLPKGEMPAGGYPLSLYFHGSGGVSSEAVDRGRISVPGGSSKKGEGPAFVVAEHGIAMLSASLPVNPERYPGAGETEYLNLQNLASLPHTFMQGAIEQRLLIDAILAHEISEEELVGCSNISLPKGESAYRFRSDGVLAMGQSMGGMYTNIIGAIDSRVKAVAPTGAGGIWHYFILLTSTVDGAKALLSVIFRTPEEELSFLHPTLQLLSLAWESAEPAVFMGRLAKDPLPTHPRRPIYQPVGLGDSYFPTAIYDAVAVAFGNQQAGTEVWPTMQEELRLAGRDGILDYPIANNRGEEGDGYTGVVVQYEGDGISDPHGIYGQLDEVKYQYGCFFASFLATGTATVPAPAPLGTPCPGLQ